MNTRLFSKAWLIGWIGAALVGVIAYYLAVTIPPKFLTVRRMKVIERRILMFATQNHRLPDKLEDLPPLQNQDNSITDGWGQPILYSFDPRGNVVLKSRYHRESANGKFISEVESTFSTKGDNGGWMDDRPSTK